MGNHYEKEKSNHGSPSLLSFFVVKGQIELNADLHFRTLLHFLTGDSQAVDFLLLLLFVPDLFLQSPQTGQQLVFLFTDLPSSDLLGSVEPRVSFGHEIGFFFFLFDFQFPLKVELAFPLLLFLLLQLQDGLDVSRQSPVLPIVQLYLFVEAREPLCLPQNLQVLEHGRRGDVVHPQVFEEQSHAIVEVAALEELLVELSQVHLPEDPAGVGVVQQDSLQQLDRSEFGGLVGSLVAEEGDQSVHHFALEHLLEYRLRVVKQILEVAHDIEDNFGLCAAAEDGREEGSD